jgi:hypothetical protein
LALVVVLLVLFIGGELIHQVANAARPADRLTDASWIASVAPIIGEAGTLNSSIGYIETHATSMGRPALSLALSALNTYGARELDDVTRASLTPPSAAARTELLQTFTTRLLALHSFSGGVERAIETGAVATSIADLARAAREEIRAQSQYRRFLTTVAKVDGHLQLPSVDLVSPVRIFHTTTLSNFAQLLVATPSLRSAPRLVIAVVSMNPLPEVIPTTTSTTIATTTTTPTRHRRAGPSTTTTLATTSGKRRTRTVTTTTTTTTTTLPPTSPFPSGVGPSVYAPTPSVHPIVVVRNSGNVTATQVQIVATLADRSITSAPISTLLPGHSIFVELHSLAVNTAAMTACQVTTLRHDRCSSLIISLQSRGVTVAHHAISVAFYVP